MKNYFFIFLNKLNRVEQNFAKHGSELGAWGGVWVFLSCVTDLFLWVSSVVFFFLCDISSLLTKEGVSFTTT